jgi:hypothetical protein
VKGVVRRISELERELITEGKKNNKIRFVIGTVHNVIVIGSVTMR